MLDSVHSARWLSRFSNQEIEFLLFPSSPNRRIHPGILRLVRGDYKANYSLVPLASVLAIPMWAADKILGNALRGAFVRSEIKRFGPEIVHAMELQHAGYIALRALENFKSPQVKLASTNWGSDIFWFQQFPRHRSIIRRLLRISDVYSAECERDVELAKKFGYTGAIMPTFPNSGGFSEGELGMFNIGHGTRDLIVVKGYQGWVGRAKIALHALAAIADKIENLHVVVISGDKGTARLANRLYRQKKIVNLTVHRKGSLDHSQVLELLRRARVFVGISLSDGISTTMLEAMAMGAIPVQTSTACCDEWFTETGISVKEITVQSVGSGILKGLALANEDEAILRNRQAVLTRASWASANENVKKFYHSSL